MSNSISSYKISDKKTWLFYDNPNFEHLLFKATGPSVNWESVPSGSNDKVSSVRPRGGSKFEIILVSQDNLKQVYVCSV